jgi:hypothetical protein
MLRGYPRRICFVEIEQSVTEYGQSEVVVRFGGPLDFTSGFNRYLQE